MIAEAQIVNEISVYLNTLDKDIKENCLEPAEKEIYHYTDLNALHNIIINKNFRFSNILFMNDPSELDYGLSMIYDAFDFEGKYPYNYKNYDHSNKDRYEKYYKDESYIEFCKRIISFNSEVNALSLTSEKDSLAFWRSYSKNGTGVCIAIKTSELKEKPLKVIYDKKLQKGITEKISLEIKNLFRKYDVFSMRTAVKKIILDYISNLIQYYSSFIKDNGYSYEKEFRLSFTRNLSEFAKKTIKNKTNFRITNLGLSPYVVSDCELLTEDVGLEIKNIEEIILGPKLNFKLNSYSLNLLLKQEKLNHIKVSFSKLKMR